MVKGRFAPSPTGPLHFGSLIAATASYLQARTQQGQWLVRIEDLDPPREQPGATDHILRTLEAFGFEWDGEVMLQSSRHTAYEAALSVLKHQDQVYLCTCTRKEIADSAIQGIDGAIYPGTCRHAQHTKGAWRVITYADAISFEDAIQGKQSQNLLHDLGDFVLKRADGFYTYQLAVVVDDAAQGITQVVRGTDLLSSTPRQIYLQRLLQLPMPQYAHLPIATNAQGEKLSKQRLAKPLDTSKPTPELWQALQFLGQSPPQALQSELQALWHWALTHWQLTSVPHLVLSRPYD
ncbi:MAG: tRNA glutamyl-Q(34) synthetase GluQRS [Methylophilaceae bacterium]